MNKAARRAALLTEMGLGPRWRLRDQPGFLPRQKNPAPHQVEKSCAAPAAAASLAVLQQRMVGLVSPQSVPVSLQVVADEVSAEPTVALQQAPAMDEGWAERISGLDWVALAEKIRLCQGCVLFRQREQAVPGIGGHGADWLLVGEGPGAEEDHRGEPFVGQAGKLLDAMLAALGLQRGEQVYIANAVKCRPPLNRTPTSEEIACCRPYLQRQIALLRPRVIVALGRVAAQSLLQQENIRISQLRGKCFDYVGIPVVVTYHPAYLLRNLAEKGKVWQDLCLARSLLVG